MNLKDLSAPDARLLVVDDTPMALNQFKGLLRRSNITLDTASNGYEALSLAASNRYDIIFIDYLMPDMDGTETLHSIRNMAEDLNSKTPCIVVSGNADADNADSWLESGFDDWLSKPVKANLFCDILIKYIPADKVTDSSVCSSDPPSLDDTDAPAFFKAFSQLPEIDAVGAVENCGGMDELKDILNTFSMTGEDSAERIEQALKNGDISSYTILVHALKSSARLVGAMDLGDAAEKLENAGARQDVDYINSHSKTTIDLYRSLSARIGEALKEGVDKIDDSSLPPITQKRLSGAYQAIYELVTADDFDSARGVAAALSQYRLPPEEKDFFRQLDLLLVRVDRDGIRQLLTGKY